MPLFSSVVGVRIQVSWNFPKLLIADEFGGRADTVEGLSRLVLGVPVSYEFWLESVTRPFQTAVWVVLSCAGNQRPDLWGHYSNNHSI